MAKDQSKAKPEAAGAPAATGGFEYASVEVPAKVSGASNPHLAKVRELNDARVAGTPQAAAFVIPKGPEHDRLLGRNVRHLQEAGQSLGITVRKTTETTDAGTRVTFWPTEKITRKPRATETSGTSPVPVA